jgi:hypothetical protein
MCVLRKGEVEAIFLATNDGKPETFIVRESVEEGASLFKLYCVQIFRNIEVLVHTFRSDTIAGTSEKDAIARSTSPGRSSSSDAEVIAIVELATVLIRLLGPELAISATLFKLT